MEVHTSSTYCVASIFLVTAFCCLLPHSLESNIFLYTSGDDTLLNILSSFIRSNFYGNLQKLVDSYVVKTLDTLTETGLLDDTLIVNMADHGELGLSHG